MGKTYDVVALGELLIDFTENGVSEQGNPIMEANPGGAPCNVLSMLTRLGHHTGFIGKVGRDMFGEQLRQALAEAGISLEGLVLDSDIHTTLAFVHTFPDGDRDFSFYRNPGADMMLAASDVKEDMIRNSRIFHFGSLSMTDSVVRNATRHALSIAREAGCIITFDPNLREPLWRTLEEAKEQIAYGMARCDVMKISDNEIQWFTGEKDYAAGVRILQETYPQIKLILVSLGKEGSMAFTKENHTFVPSFLQSRTIETTGAGDTFCACIIHYILEHGLYSYDEAEMKEMLAFANAAASLITTRKGALRVMPSKEEVEEMLNRVRTFIIKEELHC